MASSALPFNLPQAFPPKGNFTLCQPIPSQKPHFQRRFQWTCPLRNSVGPARLRLRQETVGATLSRYPGTNHRRTQSDFLLEDVELFFGPIVVLEKSGGTVQLKEFLVIDGQQRITTVYLLLAIIQAQLRASKHLSIDASDHVDKLNRYLMNDVDGSDDYLKLKVFSSKGDRLPSYRVVFGSDANPKTPMLQADLQLYVPGKNRVDEFQAYAIKKIKAQYRDVPSLWQLAQALLNCLKIVWIPLDQERDDRQAIFESLKRQGHATQG